MEEDDDFQRFVDQLVANPEKWAFHIKPLFKVESAQGEKEKG